MTPPPEPERSPWWSADDERFAEATPLFGDARRSPQDEGSETAEEPGDATGSLPPPGATAGSPIAEALRLASAVSAWSNQSGLTDTLRQIAGEATETLAAMASDVTAPAPSSAEPPVSEAADAAEPSDRPDPQWYAHQSVCDYCPLCRGLEVMRTVQPQMSQGVAESMASLTAALNYALESLAARNRPR